MKKVFICAFALFCMVVNGNAQLSVTSALKERKEIRKASKSELNEKASKAARKDVRKLSKEGWLTAPEALPLEKQIEITQNIIAKFDELTNEYWIFVKRYVTIENVI